MLLGLLGGIVCMCFGAVTYLMARVRCSIAATPEERKNEKRTVKYGMHCFLIGAGLFIFTIVIILI
jgi:hypothetical protein